jgi:hypothetical protein
MNATAATTQGIKRFNTYFSAISERSTVEEALATLTCPRDVGQIRLREPQ